VIILNKDAIADLEVELDFGRGVSGAVETEILHAPALDSPEAHITTSRKTDSLRQGKCSVIIPGATGLRLTLSLFQRDRSKQCGRASGAALALDQSAMRARSID
jgi:hypothetical protein